MNSPAFGEKCHEVASQRHVSEAKVKIVWCARPVGHTGKHRFTRDPQVVSEEKRAPQPDEGAE